MDSALAVGPAKYVAVSPGSTRVSRNVTSTTPQRVGRAPAKRNRTARIGRASGVLRQEPEIRLPAGPIRIAAHVFLHRDVVERLADRDHRHLVHAHLQEAF